MENIRASEIRRYAQRTFFGFSRFLLMAFTIINAVATFFIVGYHTTVKDVLESKLWLFIIPAVIAGILFFMHIAKRKWFQAVIALLYVVFNALCAAKVIDIVDYTLKAKAALDAAGVNTSSASVIESVSQAFQSPEGIAKSACLVGSLIFGVLSFIFAIRALRKFRSPTMDTALNAKINDIKAHPETNPGMNPKKLIKRTNKMARKEKYVDYCHALDVLCILDDPSQNEKYFIPGESKFYGQVISLVFLRILWTLLNVITLGIMIPWTTSWKYKYLAQRTMYSGKKVKFDGKGIQLLGRWILWELLSIVTLGIYAFFMANALKKWVVKHQHLEDEPDAESSYNGTTFGRGLMVFFLRILQFMSLGIATAFVENTICKYDMSHTIISGHQLMFGGTTSKLFARYLLWLALSVVTMSIYAIFVLPLNMTRYKTKFSRIQDLSYNPESDPR